MRQYYHPALTAALTAEGFKQPAQTRPPFLEVVVRAVPSADFPHISFPSYEVGTAAFEKQVLVWDGLFTAPRLRDKYG
jgi:hypothetical protein